MEGITALRDRIYLMYLPLRCKGTITETCSEQLVQVVHQGVCAQFQDHWVYLFTPLSFCRVGSISVSSWYTSSSVRSIWSMKEEGAGSDDIGGRANYKELSVKVE